MINTFDSLNKLAGVTYAGSEQDQNPLHDPNVTIFLENGYRLISAKSALGQSVDVDPTTDDLLAQGKSSLKAQIYHSVIGIAGYQMPQDKFLEVKNNCETQIDIENFSKKLIDIVGEDLMEFLKERHQSINLIKVKKRLTL